MALLSIPDIATLVVIAGLGLIIVALVEISGTIKRVDETYRTYALEV